MVSAGRVRIESRRGSAAGADHGDRLCPVAVDGAYPFPVATAMALRRDRVGVVRSAPEPEVVIRCLADYDTALDLYDHTNNADGRAA